MGKYNPENNGKALSSAGINYKIKVYNNLNKIIEAYSKIAYYSGFASGFGSDLDDPCFGNLEKLLKAKKNTGILPKEITELKVFKRHMKNIDKAIAYCSGIADKKDDKTIKECLNEIDRELDTAL